MADWLQFVRLEPLTYFFKGVAYLGHGPFLLMFLPVLYWCWRKRTAAHLIFLILVTGYICFTLKNIFKWERPPTELWLASTTGYSFPSSHAMVAVVMWGFLAHEIKKKWATIVAILLILLIMISRVYLGVHYIQDVLAGAAVGGAILYLYRWSVNGIAAIIDRLPEYVEGLAVLAICILLALPQGDTLFASTTGLLAGTYLGFLFEHHYADFAPSGKWHQLIIRTVLGLVILLTIKQGLEWILPENTGFMWFKYFVIGLWMMVGAPWIFIQLQLAKREN